MWPETMVYHTAQLAAQYAVAENRDALRAAGVKAILIRKNQHGEEYVVAVFQEPLLHRAAYIDALREMG